MAAVKGYRSEAAFVKATTWDTAVVCGALHGIPFLSEKMTKSVALDPNEEVDLDASPLAGDKSSQKYSGSIETYMRYGGLDRLLGHLLGSDTISTIDAATAYRHEILPMNDREGLFGTLAINKGNQFIEEFAGVKVTGLTIVMKPGKAVATWDLVASSLAINTSTGTNTTTTFASVTLPTPTDPILWNQIQFHIKPVSDAAAFGAGDLAYVNEITVEIKQAMVEDDYSTRGGTLIDEPIADGKWQVMLKVGWRKADTAAQAVGNMILSEAALNKTQYKARILCTGPGIGSGTNVQTAAFWFPLIQAETGYEHNIGGSGVAPLSINFKSHRSATLPTGFPTGGTTPISIDIQNGISASGIA